MADIFSNYAESNDIDITDGKYIYGESIDIEMKKDGPKNKILESIIIIIVYSETSHQVF